MSQSLLHQAPGTAPMEALLCYELEPYQEFLLCFSKFGIYISYDGKRARQSEIMWPSQVRLHSIVPLIFLINGILVLSIDLTITLFL